jgi:hypothetical protein
VSERTYPDDWFIADLNPTDAESDADRQWIEDWNTATLEQRREMLDAIGSVLVGDSE